MNFPYCEYPDGEYEYYRFVNRTRHPLRIYFCKWGLFPLECAPGTALVYSHLAWKSVSQAEPSFKCDYILFAFYSTLPSSEIEPGPQVIFSDSESYDIPNPCSYTNWTYEKIDDCHVRWTYIITEKIYQYGLAHPLSAD